MSLYGLDILMDRKGRYFLSEINGIRSGMDGFKEVYGDDRVKEKVYSMLRESYGLITVNDGSYRHNKFLEEHPVKSKFIEAALDMPVLKTFFIPRIFTSRKAYIDWINEEVKNEKRVEFPFEVYKGQKSTVLNVVNEILPHPTVNQYISEEISRNKFLQYLLLKSSDISEYLPKSSLVGLGFANKTELEELLKDSSLFMLKPILGSCGKGIKLLKKKDVKSIIHTNGPIYDPDIITCIKKEDLYLEDLIDKGDFSFESAVSIIQPFIDSRAKLNGQDIYSSVRAIICNGTFVDAYLRVSSDFKVNLSQKAKAVEFKGANGFDKLCKKIIARFENECSKLDPKSFKSRLYKSYLEDKRTSKEERLFNTFTPIMAIISRLLKTS